MDMSPNTVHMAWQIPQYFLMTAGEVVFSVTGLEFSYSQVRGCFAHESSSENNWKTHNNESSVCVCFCTQGTQQHEVCAAGWLAANRRCRKHHRAHYLWGCDAWRSGWWILFNLTHIVLKVHSVWQNVQVNVWNSMNLDSCVFLRAKLTGKGATCNL